MVELVSFERTRLDEDAAAALNLKPGDAAWQNENRLRLQGKPVVHDRLTISATLFRGLTEKRWRERPSTIYHRYQSEFGITVVRAHERLRAVGADRAAACVLGLPLGQAVLQVRRVALGLGGQPVEWRVSTVVTGHHDYVNLLSRPTWTVRIPRRPRLQEPARAALNTATTSRPPTAASAAWPPARQRPLCHGEAGE